MFKTFSNILIIVTIAATILILVLFTLAPEVVPNG